MSFEAIRFGFGKNWENYIQQHFSDERVEISRTHLLGFLQMDNLKGKSFLDIGCGSGLHSLAALRAGAAKIVSFDFDPDAVKTATKLKEFAGNPAQWQVMQGSILDGAFSRTLEPADIVYSWGVLHHTGDLWQALRNTAILMKKNGILYVALYTDEPYFGLSKEYWMGVKRHYNRAGWIAKRQLEWWYFWEFYFQKDLARLPDFFKQAKEYKRSRGMDMYIDAVDWLGGWPFEFASVEQVKHFGAEQLGLVLINLGTGQANAEYLFQNRNLLAPSTLTVESVLDAPPA